MLILFRKRPLLSTVMWEWYEDYKYKIDLSTAYNYKKEIERTLVFFKLIRVDKLTSEKIQEFIDSLGKDETLANNTIHDITKPLKFSLQYAVEKKYITFSPFKRVRLPKRTRKEIFPFSEQEMLLLLKQKCLPWVRDAIIIAYHTGMRLGEIFGLKWSDINFDKKFIMVQRSQSRAGSHIKIKTTKTPSGVRRIDIDSYLNNYLINMKACSNSDFVFSMPEDGRMRIPWNISKIINGMCIAAGIPPRSFHALRHTHATILLTYGIHPKIVQERLGHSDITVTLSTYSYVIPTLQRVAADVFEKIGNESESTLIKVDFFVGTENGREAQAL